MLGDNLRWTSIPSRGSRNTPSRFILQKPEISAGTDEPSGSPNYDWGRLYLTFTYEQGVVASDLEPERITDTRIVSLRTIRTSHTRIIRA